LQTLELRHGPRLGNPVLELRALHSVDFSGRSSPSVTLPAVGFSKIEDYLADNICFSMLSEVMDRVQEQSDWAAGLVPNWELRIALPGSV
jgi:hypothetical protein